MILNRSILFLIALLLSLSCQSKDNEIKEKNPAVESKVEAKPQGLFEAKANWSFDAKKISDCEMELRFTANVKKDWYIYSSKGDSTGIGLPTSFSINKNENFELIGKASEGKGKVKTDEMGSYKYFPGKAVFKQRIKLLSGSDFNISGTLEYMACNSVTLVCTPPEEVEFTFNISGDPICGDAQGANPDSKDPPLSGENTQNPAPKDHTDVIDEDVTQQADPAGTNEDDTLTNENLEDTIVPENAPSTQITNAELEPGCGDGATETDLSWWGIFIAGFIGGLLALLTPCVFPMIPLTVSFFTKNNKKKGIFNAIVYAVSIIVIYVTIGFIVTKSFGPDALNVLASSMVFNLLFFFVFVIFAISFFGAFEITLPNSFISKVDKASDRGGLLGIFFMAFTLALVSFSCTGPIIGTLLVEAAIKGSYVGPIIGMFGFSLALALPFALFAIFPSWLSSLPRSGGWLNSVKVSLGFIELALALKFLSTVDLAYHWGFLKREIFLVIWIVIFGMLGFYLLGKLRLPHDSELKHVSIPRLMFAILSFAFTIYLIPGLWGAPLKLISGFPPPSFYREWISPDEASHCPHNLNCFHDYEEGMAYAKAENKPVLLDFTGWACQNCRRMEDNVWSDPEVLKRISEKYVLISLYVDDKAELPKEEQYVSDFTGKKIKTLGNKWSEMQAKRYNKNSQPYYVLLDHQEKLLAEPEQYNPDIPNYIDFLDEGLCRFNKRQSQ